MTSRCGSIALIGVPVTVGSLLLAPRTIDFLYGPSFAAAVLTYQLLVLVIPVRMVEHTLSLSLAATDQQTRRTVAVTVAAVANVGLNCWFIPRWSYLGAAVTTVICEVGLVVAYAVLLRRVAGRSQLLRANGWPLLASRADGSGHPADRRSACARVGGGRGGGLRCGRRRARASAGPR